MVVWCFQQTWFSRGLGSGAVVSSTLLMSVPPFGPFLSLPYRKLLPGEWTQVMASVHLTPSMGRSCISYSSVSHVPRPWVAHSAHLSGLTVLPLCSCPTVVSLSPQPATCFLAQLLLFLRPCLKCLFLWKAFPDLPKLGSSWPLEILLHGTHHSGN